MKKIAMLALLLAVTATGTNADAQLLNKLKNKAEQAIGNKIAGNKTQGAAQSTVSQESPAMMVPIEVKDEPQDETPAQVQQSNSQQGVQVKNPDQQLEKRRASTFAWDEKITPSTQSFPIPLLNELPALPSAESLANPTEEEMNAFYRAIKKVTLRAEQLNADETCMDDFAKQWREKQANKIAEAYGLTRAEWDAYESGNLSQSEREAIEKKMVNAMFGGVDLQKAAADAEENIKKMQSMSESELQAKMFKVTMEAMIKVYESDPAETKYLTGKTTQEMRTLLEKEGEYQASQLKAGNDDPKPGPGAKEMMAYSEKMKAKDGAAYSKREQAFQKKLQDAMTKASRDASGMGDMMTAMDNMNSFEEKIGAKDMTAMSEKFIAKEKPMWEALHAESSEAATEEFSATEKKKLEDIRAKIDATNDPKVYNPLYLQAEESIKTYRTRAAEAWRAKLQKQIDNIKAQMPSYMKVMREEVEAGFIPECALLRSPLNVVIETGDILDKAYAEFPDAYPSMYSESVEYETEIGPEETFWHPEFYTANSVEAALSPSSVFKRDSNGNIFCKGSGSGWSAVAEDFDTEKLKGTEEQQSGTWTSSDGKRTAIYNAVGHWLQLPEGDIITPVAIQKIGNTIVWVQHNQIDAPNGSSKLQLIKCTYKL